MVDTNYRVADLTPAEMQQLQMAEEQLGMVLVAYKNESLQQTTQEIQQAYELSGVADYSLSGHVDPAEQ